MVAKLLQFDDISYPDELIVKSQGKDMLRAFRSKISVPIDHIESITVFEPANIQDDQGLVKVGAGSLSRRSKVGARKSSGRNHGKAVEGKAITIALEVRDAKNLPLRLTTLNRKR